MLKKLAVLAVAASLVTPAIAADNWLGKAQAINAQQIGKRDSAARQVFKREGSAAQDKTVSHTVNLRAGKFYGFMADCDYECNEAKLELVKGGEVLGEMFEADNSSPMFGFRAEKSGAYTLKYTITECEKNRCAYSAQVFEGNKEYDLDF